MPTDQHRGSVTDNLNPMADLKWRPDGSELVFLSSSRDRKTAWLRSANATTGAVREVFHETSPTQFEVGAERWSALARCYGRRTKCSSVFRPVAPELRARHAPVTTWLTADRLKEQGGAGARRWRLLAGDLLRIDGLPQVMPKFSRVGQQR